MERSGGWIGAMMQETLRGQPPKWRDIVVQNRTECATRSVWPGAPESPGYRLDAGPRQDIFSAPIMPYRVYFSSISPFTRSFD